MGVLILLAYTVYCHLLQNCQRGTLAQSQSRFSRFVDISFEQKPHHNFPAMHLMFIGPFFNVYLFLFSFTSVQELTEYELMSYYYPEFCQKMQMEITNILLQNIYIMPNSCFQKAQTIVRKGKALRFCGIGGLSDCIQCLSEAIIILVSCLVCLPQISNLYFL